MSHKPACRFSTAGAAALLLTPSWLPADLVVSGVDAEIEQNIRAYVSLASEPCGAEAWRIRRQYRAIGREVRKALEPFGFYEPAIRSTLNLDDECWRASLEIDPGQPVLLRDVDIVIRGEASADPAFAGLMRSPSLQPGRPLRHPAYERLKQALQIRAADRGYVEADFTASRLDIWPDDGVADITVHFDSGPRYRVGEITIEQSFLDPAIVSGYLDIQSGRYFDNQEVARAYRELSESAYFGRVEVVPELENAADTRIPIRVSLQPGTRIEYTVGLGASTDTGLRFRAGYRNNRLNKEGHRLISDLEVSPVVQGLNAEYRIPLSDPRREWFSVTAAVVNEDTDTFDNDAQRLGVRWTKAMSDTWLRTLAVDFNNESFNVGTDVDTSRTLVPSVSFDHKKSDRDVFPRYGRRLGLELRGTDQMLGSNTSYLQATAWLRLIRSFGTGNRMIARLNAGIISSSNFAELPPSVRYFAGGDESVRGYAFDSLGPKDADGNVIGGNNLLVGSIEYERHLWSDFYGAVFVDAGNAFDHTDFDPEVGSGLGFKWRSPLGLVRVYLGYPVTADDRGIRFHLRLGSDL